jgi:hypothetical protein
MAPYHGVMTVVGPDAAAVMPPRPVAAQVINQKTCTGCNTSFPATGDYFYSQKRGVFGLASRCKKCASLAVMESRKRLDPTFERIRKWRRENRDLHNLYAKRARANRSEERKELHRAWRRENERKRRADPKFRFLQSVRTQINLIVHGKFDGKGLLRRLGYTREQLISHIERQFTRGMTWENYGKLGRGWEIDHIIPVSSFDMTDDEQFRACWALTNLRPMWALANRSKQARRELLL